MASNCSLGWLRPPYLSKRFIFVYVPIKLKRVLRRRPLRRCGGAGSQDARYCIRRACFQPASSLPTARCQPARVGRIRKHQETGDFSWHFPIRWEISENVQKLLPFSAAGWKEWKKKKLSLVLLLVNHGRRTNDQTTLKKFLFVKKYR